MLVYLCLFIVIMNLKLSLSLKSETAAVESVVVELVGVSGKYIIVGVIYRPPDSII